MPRKKSQNKNSGYKDKLFRIDAELAADLESIAEEQGTSQTTIVHEALKLYRDKRYMSEKASALPSELTETLLAANALLEKKLNAKSNQLLSSMGIELFVITERWRISSKGRDKRSCFPLSLQRLSAVQKCFQRQWERKRS